MSSTALTKSSQTAATVKGYLEKNKTNLLKAMPSGANYERFARTAINAISTTPALGNCDAISLTRACIKAFSVGIEPNGPTQEGYIVPFGGQAQFLPSYRGLVSLAVRSGMVNDVHAYIIHANDKYSVQYGTEPKIEHSPLLGKDRGDMIAVYAIAKLKSGVVAFELMDKADVDKIRAMSKSKDGDAWVKSYDEMSKKTVIKRLTKNLPVSTENMAFAQAVAMDNSAESGDDSDGIIDIEGLDLPEPEVKKSVFEKKKLPESKPENPLDPVEEPKINFTPVEG